MEQGYQTGLFSRAYQPGIFPETAFRKLAFENLAQTKEMAMGYYCKKCGRSFDNLQVLVNCGCAKGGRCEPL